MVLKKLKNNNQQIHSSVIYSLSSNRHLLSSYFLNSNDTSLLINKFNKYSILNYKSLYSFYKLIFPLSYSVNFIFSRKLLLFKLYKYIVITDQVTHCLLFPFKGSFFIVKLKLKRPPFFLTRLFKYTIFRSMFRFKIFIKYSFKRFNTIRNSYASVPSSGLFFELCYSSYSISNFFLNYKLMSCNFSNFSSKFYLNSNDYLDINQSPRNLLYHFFPFSKLVKYQYTSSPYFYFFSFFKFVDVSSFDILYNSLFLWYRGMGYNIKYRPHFTNFIDIFFRSSIFEKIIGLLTRKGFKEKSERVFFRTILLIKNRFNFNPFYFFIIILNNIYYLFDLKKVKAYGKMQTIPILISHKKSFFLSMKLLFSSIKNKKNYIPFEDRLVDVLYNCFRKEGSIYEQYKNYIQLCKNNQFLINYFIK